MRELSRREGMRIKILKKGSKVKDWIGEKTSLWKYARYILMYHRMHTQLFWSALRGAHASSQKNEGQLTCISVLTRSWYDLSSYILGPDRGTGSFQKLNSNSSWFFLERSMLLLAFRNSINSFERKKRADEI